MGKEQWVWLYDGRGGILTGRKFDKLWEVVMNDGTVVFSEAVATQFFTEGFSV